MRSLQVLLLCLSLCLSLSLSSFVEDEVASWELLGAASPSDQVQLTIAIKQQNVEQLKAIFWQVSDPQSPNYGKFLSADEVSQLVMPSSVSLKSVSEWVLSHGIQEHEMTFTRSMDMVTVNTNVATASVMLNAKYSSYKHSSSGRVIIKSSESYTVPAVVSQHVDCIVGHTSFPVNRPLFVSPSSSSPSSSSSVGADAPVTPTVLRQRYNVSNNLVGTAPNNSYAVAEFQGQYYSPSDLQTFFKSEVPFAPDAYTVAHVVGNNDGNSPGVEANLDIQFIMGVAPKITSWFWSNSNMDFFSDIVTWLGQIDNTTDAPLVHSVSYGSQVQWPSKDVHDRVDIEFQKSGARGISIIFASGDSGTGCLLCTKFRPSWPASSDYVTSVGATRFIDGTSGDEMAVSEFGSGGGFSSDDNQPSYQTAAVANYFKVQTDLPESFFYNQSGRGTPDVAALGIGFQVVVNGRVQSVGGTSASAPTFSGIISLLNDIRLNKGKAPLGFLNPWLYQTQASSPSAFFDVTKGNNRHGCCGLTGFQAAPGWDPVTGLGTPNFHILSQLV